MENKFNFNYSIEDDILSIYSNSSPEESIEFSENLVIDIDKDNGIVGLEIFDAAEFFNTLNEQIDRDFLEKLEEVHLECKEFRNNWYILLLFKANGKEIRQPMPLLRKSEYKSPLIVSCA
ncbi:MAG: DUF2283 domain-containing protein [Candidatus Pacearchaeota archaeon]|nr:DUF2283 domain-containing protein [Candidatus Pacearchaeota archaeon]